MPKNVVYWEIWKIRVKYDMCMIRKFCKRQPCFIPSAKASASSMRVGAWSNGCLKIHDRPRFEPIKKIMIPPPKIQSEDTNYTVSHAGFRYMAFPSLVQYILCSVLTLRLPKSYLGICSLQPPLTTVTWQQGFKWERVADVGLALDSLFPAPSSISSFCLYKSER